MKIALNSIDQEQTITISGNEDWLKRIYEDFTANSHNQAVITGTLKITRESDDGAMVQGNLAYAPAIPCSRCTQPVNLELKLSISTRFYPEIDNPDRSENWRRERNLSLAELDAYYVIDGEIDLEEVINDSIHAELPSSFIPDSSEQHPCLVDHEDPRGVRVFGEDPAKSARSPFDALRRIKLPE